MSSLSENTTGDFPYLRREIAELPRVATGQTQETTCYVAGCEEAATTQCERCKRPICDSHTREIANFFTDTHVPYCPSCEEKHYQEREY